nr:hypothetical protein [Escherichia coli O25b:H4-ST131]
MTGEYSTSHSEIVYAATELLLPASTRDNTAPHSRTLKCSSLENVLKASQDLTAVEISSM